MRKSYNDESQYKNTVMSNESKKRDTLYAGFDNSNRNSLHKVKYKKPDIESELEIRVDDAGSPSPLEVHVSGQLAE